VGKEDNTGKRLISDQNRAAGEEERAAPASLATKKRSSSRSQRGSAWHEGKGALQARHAGILVLGKVSEEGDYSPRGIN